MKAGDGEEAREGASQAIERTRSLTEGEFPSTRDVRAIQA